MCIQHLPRAKSSPSAESHDEDRTVVHCGLDALPGRNIRRVASVRSDDQVCESSLGDLPLTTSRNACCERWASSAAAYASS